MPKKKTSDKALELKPNIESTADDAADALAAITQAIPGIGGVVGAFISGAVNQRRMGRVADELQRLHQDLKDHKEKIREEYVKSEDFEELLLETLEQMAKELDPQRRAVYRRYLKNLMTEPPIKYANQRKLLRLAEELAPAHLVVLGAIGQSPAPGHIEGFMAPIQVLRERTASAISLRDDQLAQCVRDLELEGLVSQLEDRLSTTMNASSAVNLTNSVTTLGRDFRRFVKE